MNILYNSILRTGQLALHLIASNPWLCPSHSKLRKLATAQEHVIRQIREAFLKGARDSRPVIWIHAASLGEFGVARPIIRQLHAQKKWNIVVTFFSPTGYEALSSSRHPGIDHVFYLPWDTRRQAAAFLDIIRPRKAIFIISEYWLNYLGELKRRAIPTYLVSAVIRKDAPFFRWYGGAFRRSLDTFTHFMVLNPSSAQLLARLGHHNATVTGDPLFDNVIAVASTPYRNPIVERFAAGRPVFIAGSTSDRKDLELVCTLANRHPDMRFIIVPHEISEEGLNRIRYHLRGPARLYSECSETTDFQHTQTLIIDFLGALAYLYRYGTWAYVGGGFTPYLHSIIEPAVYGLPVAFGPKTRRKVTPRELAARGIGKVVRSAKELDNWLQAMQAHPERLAAIKEATSGYTRQNAGATREIMHILTDGHEE